MEKKDIIFPDWKRLFLGDAPMEFLLEVLIRTLIIYVVFLIVARLLGKRMSGQLTLTETAVMITLGAIISSPMQDPQKGLFEGILVLILALLFYRGFNLWGYKSSKFEKITQGQSSMLVKDGILCLSEMEKTRLSKQELFAQLRHKNIYNLGMVKRVYLEGCGMLNVFTETENKPGLPILPEIDREVQCVLKEDKKFACCNCGKVMEERNNCSNCGSDHLIPAAMNK